MYFIAKTAHILFVVSWLACVFVLPRALLHYKIAHESNRETEALQFLSMKLFRFGLLMFLLALVFGMWLWLGFGINGVWLHIKLALVGLLLLYFLASGWLLRRARESGTFPSGLALRIFNESSLLFVIPIIYLAVSKNA
ncbi:CopD family protein [Rheinheimera sp.]|uniref:CopD family protein n=1 Tax=Rheinheimera sp. TaxID=1869214 RepID=UPI0037C86597